MNGHKRSFNNILKLSFTLCIKTTDKIDYYVMEVGTICKTISKVYETFVASLQHESLIKEIKIVVKLIICINIFIFFAFTKCRKLYSMFINYTKLFV